MKALRDMYCEDCGEILTDVFCGCSEEFVCNNCGTRRIFKSKCTGGTKSRFRENDIPTDPAFYRGQVSVSAPTVSEVETGRPVRDLKGVKISDNKKFSEDSRAERLDRVYFNQDKKRGSGKIYSYK